MDLSQYTELFRAETRDHLTTLNRLLLEWEQQPDQPEPVAGIFRAVHTVKGMAATMGYARVADLAHRAETLLDLLRSSGRADSEDELEVLFRTADALEALQRLRDAGEADALWSVEHLAARAAGRLHHTHKRNCTMNISPVALFIRSRLQEQVCTRRVWL